MKRLIASASIWLLFGTTVFARQGDLGTWMDGIVRKLPPEKRFRGNIFAERNGRVLLEKSYGLAVEGWNIPNTTQTKFEIASVSKQFTAAAILQLAEAGNSRSPTRSANTTKTHHRLGARSQSTNF
jgi:hypothetical protein